MAKEQENLTQEQAYNAPVPNILQQRIAAGAIVSGAGADAGTNPHALVNEFNLGEKKTKWVKAAYDKQGIALPMAALQLALDAIRPIRHSRTLATNINKANPGQARPDNTDAHHIVGRTDYRAHESRVIIYSKGIAINDADNGGYFPRYKTTFVPSMPNAHNHQGMHTESYYLNVYLRLVRVANGPTMDVRMALRGIKSELIAGTFPI
jgi:hypothetical protein